MEKYLLPFLKFGQWFFIGASVRNFFLTHLPFRYGEIDQQELLTPPLV